MNSLGVTATRKTLTSKQLTFFRLLIDPQSCDELHLGGCVGGDEAIFDMAVPFEHIKIVVHPPLDERWMMPRWKWKLRDNIEVREAKDFIPRNHDIVDESHRMAAAPDSKIEKMRGSGTWATIRYSRETHTPLVICYPGGEISP